MLFDKVVSFKCVLGVIYINKLGVLIVVEVDELWFEWEGLLIEG